MDTFLFQKLNSLAGASSFSDNLFIFLADTFAYVLVAILALVFLWPKFFGIGDRMVVVWALIAGFFARFVVKEVVVFFYNRPRPFDIFSDVVQLVSHESLGSFPSGHAIFFFALASVLVFYSRGLGTFFFISAIFLGFSRIISGIHWPSDILAGASLGIFAGVFVFYLIRKFWEIQQYS